MRCTPCKLRLLIFVFPGMVLCSLCCALLSEAVFNPSNLTYKMAHKQLTQVPTDIPSESVNIYLQNNRISTITDYAFIENEDCKDLKLNDNKLENIKYKMFKGLRSLKWLDLSENHITHIGPKSFAESTELHVLYLADNYLKTLSEDILPEGHNLSNLKLHGNPLPRDSVELCWIHQGAMDGWITGFTLDAQTAARCNDNEPHNSNTRIPTTRNGWYYLYIVVGRWVWDEHQQGSHTLRNKAERDIIRCTHRFTNLPQC